MIRKALKVFFIGIFTLSALMMLIALATTTPEDKAKWAQEASAKKAKSDKEDHDREAIMTGEGCKKDGNAIIGEHKSRTLKCGWGKPMTINRTSNAYGTREQWVYAGYHSYLYFEGDVLTSIQN